eukprot:9532364-Alexandrium_andersonii.AAC.1
MEEVSETEIDKQSEVFDSRFVYNWKNGEVRARLCVRDYANEKRDDIFSPTPTPLVIRALLLYAIINDYAAQVCDFCTAFMPAECTSKTF